MERQMSQWCFTINNPVTDVREIWQQAIYTHPRFKYCVYQLETAESGTPHYQGYIEFTRSVRFAAVKGLLGETAHLEARHGPRDAARAYCMKDDTRLDGPWELGEYQATRQGHRSDLEDVVATMQTSRSLGSVIRAHPIAAIKYSKGISQSWRYLKPKTQRRPPQVYLLYGPTGMGKTRFVKSQPNLYTKSGVDQWFDDYDGHANLLIDDFAGAKSRIPLSFFLQILDRYDCMVPVKGGFVDLIADQIYVTSNLHPKLWYDYTKREEHYRALARRFHKVYWFASSGLKASLEPSSFWEAWYETCDEETTFQLMPNETRPCTPISEDISVTEISD